MERIEENTGDNNNKYEKYLSLLSSHPRAALGRHPLAKTSGNGKILVRDEPIASITQEALEGYASGRFQLQVEVKQFLESFPNFLRDRKGEVRNQHVTDLLTKVLYAGYAESGDWGVSLRSGRHEGLFTLERYKTV